MAPRRPPNLGVERTFWDAGVEYVVGIDEVGRGSWAGPLTIGAAIVPRDRRVNRIRDSKQLTERSDDEPMPLPDGLDELEISRW